MITLTRDAALKIQAKQVAHYARNHPEIDVAGIVAANTNADMLTDGVEYDVVTVNRCIPRGGAIEMLIGKFHLYDHDRSVSCPTSIC